MQIILQKDSEFISIGMYHVMIIILKNVYHFSFLECFLFNLRVRPSFFWLTLTSSLIRIHVPCVFVKLWLLLANFNVNIEIILLIQT